MEHVNIFSHLSFVHHAKHTRERQVFATIPIFYTRYISSPACHSHFLTIRRNRLASYSDPVRTDKDSKHHRPKSADSASLLRDTALLQTALHAQRHIRRQSVPELLNVLSIDRIQAKIRLHKLRVQRKQRLGHLLNPRVLARKPSNKHGIVAVGVELGVRSAHRENGHLEFLEQSRDRPGAVLSDEFRPQFPLYNNVDLRRARMDVRRVETAGADEAQGHADSRADEGGEVFAVGLDGVAALALGDGARRGVEKVVDEVGVVEQGDAVYGCGRQLKLGDEVEVVG
jgi:hypothetical protein